MLYQTDDGIPITTHSMMKTFRRCPKQAQFKYVERLKPRLEKKPLKQGSWMHELLEAYYKGEDWREIHQRLSNKFNELFDEEKEDYGNLPDECYRMMRSYLWHYKLDEWKVHEVEFTLECEFPDGGIYRCRVDMLIEDQFGLWLVDHKNNKSLPDTNFRLLDTQSALYIVAALKNKIPVQGFIWNYIRRKAPTYPQLLKDGSRLSKKAIDTDYPTLITAIREYGLNPDDYSKQLRALQRQQYRPGEPQTSPFFRRNILEKSPDMLRRVWTEGYHTHKRLHSYFPQKNPDAVERVIDRSCSWMCSYNDVCQSELLLGDASLLKKQNYKVGDPLDYYWDKEKEVTDGN